MGIQLLEWKGSQRSSNQLNNQLPKGHVTSVCQFPYLISSSQCDVIRSQLQLGPAPKQKHVLLLVLHHGESACFSLRDHAREWRKDTLKVPDEKKKVVLRSTTSHLGYKHQE